jgi:hypothetical protein
MKFGEFLTSALSESSQTGRGCVSAGRVFTLLILIFVLGWDSSYVVEAWRWNHALLALRSAPAGLAPVPLLPDGATLLAQIGFMTVFYTVNKTAGAYTDTNVVIRTLSEAKGREPIPPTPNPGEGGAPRERVL